MENNWVKEADMAVTVCDTRGIVVAMNDKSRRTFAKYGGEKLIGSNLYDCHPEPSQRKLRQLLEEQKQNTYLSESKGKKHLIHQTPWYENGEFRGLVEISIPVEDIDKLLGK